MDILRISLSVIIPPIGVFLQVGLGLHFRLNILLTPLGHFPGLILVVSAMLRKEPLSCAPCGYRVVRGSAALAHGTREACR